MSTFDKSPVIEQFTISILRNSLLNHYPLVRFTLYHIIIVIPII